MGPKVMRNSLDCYGQGHSESLCYTIVVIAFSFPFRLYLIKYIIFSTAGSFASKLSVMEHIIISWNVL